MQQWYAAASFVVMTYYAWRRACVYDAQVNHYLTHLGIINTASLNSLTPSNGRRPTLSCPPCNSLTNQVCFLKKNFLLPRCSLPTLNRNSFMTHPSSSQLNTLLPSLVQSAKHTLRSAEKKRIQVGRSECRNAGTPSFRGTRINIIHLTMNRTMPKCLNILHTSAIVEEELGLKYVCFYR